MMKILLRIDKASKQLVPKAKKSKNKKVKTNSGLLGLF